MLLCVCFIANFLNTAKVPKDHLQSCFTKYGFCCLRKLILEKLNYGHHSVTTTVTFIDVYREAINYVDPT